MSSAAGPAMVAESLSSASALLFDFGGTLDSDGVPWKERFFRLWTAEAGPVSRERFDSAFYAADDALVGALPQDASLGQTARRLAAGLAERLACVDPRPPEHVAERFCDESRRFLSSSAALLARLARRYRLAVVSNFYGNLAAVCREAGLEPHLSAAIDSAALGCSKPDARIFRAALDALGAPPERAVFVGDSFERDMAGARALGMRHVRVAPRGSALGRACCDGDRVIAKLSELEEIFL